MEWAKENDIQVGGVNVSDENTVGGLGLVSTRDLKKDDILIQVPTAMTIQSSSDVENGVVNRRVYQEAAWWARLSLQLHSLKTKAQSTETEETTNYEPWLESLPRQLNTPIHWKEDMLKEMQYSQMIQSVEAQKTLWKDQYQTILTSSSDDDDDTSNHPVSLSYEEFIWGCEMARSRAFSGSYSGAAFNPAPFLFTLVFMTVYLGLNIGTLDQAANGAGVVLCGIVFKDFIFPKLFKNKSQKKNYVICPVIDMANHQSYTGLNNVVAFEYFANAYSLSSTTTKEDGSLSKDKELFISYGPRSNDQLVQYYGFVEVDNPNDVYIMPPLRQWDIAALEKACGRTFSPGRLQKLDKAGLLGIEGTKFDLEAENRGGGVVLSRTEGLDPAVLTALRVLVSSQEEWMAAGEAIGNFASDNSGGATNEQLARLAAVTALQQELDSKPTTLEQDIQLLRQIKQTNILDDDDKEQTQLALEFRMEKKKLLKETIQSLQN